MIDEDEDDYVDTDLPPLESDRKLSLYNLSSVAIVYRPETGNSISMSTEDGNTISIADNTERRSSIERMKDVVSIHNKTESANDQKIIKIYANNFESSFLINKKERISKILQILSKKTGILYNEKH